MIFFLNDILSPRFIFNEISNGFLISDYLERKNDEDPNCKIDDIEKYCRGLILFTGTSDGLIGKLFFKKK